MDSRKSRVKLVSSPLKREGNVALDGDCALPRFLLREIQNDDYVSFSVRI